MFGWRRLVARKVMVNLRSGNALGGFLVRRSGQLLTLREATLYEPGSDPAHIDGEAVVERSQVDFIQVL